MRRSRRVAGVLRALFLWSLAARVCYGAWDFTAPGDPDRNWSVSLSAGVAYDDNFQASESSRQSGFRESSDVKFQGNLVLQRFFLGVQYDYGITYPRDADLGGVDQTHALNVALNYSFSPRLILSVSENYINSLQPQLVVGPGNAPVSVVQAGTYVYDSVGVGLSYALTARWTLTLNGNWDIWRYQDPSVANSNDHEDYSAVLSGLYGLDPRTTVGVNYQYTQDSFVNPGPGNGLNGYSNTGFLSVVRRFNPQLSLTLNGGYTIRESQDGTVTESPSALGTVVYNYGHESTVTLTVAEALSAASVQFSRSYSAQQNTSFSLQINHRITERLHVLVVGTYQYSTFTAPLFGITLKPHDESTTGYTRLTYDFRKWVSAYVEYTRTDLVSSDRFLIQPYTRDQVGMGLTLTY